MEYSVERLGSDQLPVMRELNKLFADVFDDAKRYTGKPPSDGYLLSFLNNEDNIVLVAIMEGKVIGGLVAYTLVKFEMECKEVYLYDLAVSQDQQRGGVGRMLMEELVNISRSMGAYVVFVQADEGDGAIKFYESLHPDENLRTRSFDYLT